MVSNIFFVLVLVRFIYKYVTWYLCMALLMTILMSTGCKINSNPSYLSKRERSEPKICVFFFRLKRGVLFNIFDRGGGCPWLFILKGDLRPIYNSARPSFLFSFFFLPFFFVFLFLFFLFFFFLLFFFSKKFESNIYIKYILRILCILYFYNHLIYTIYYDSSR